MIKDLIILGSTGSIGKSTIKVLKNNKKKFKIKLLSTNSNIKTIYKQAVEFKVKHVLINNVNKYQRFKKKFKKKKLKFTSILTKH